MSDTPATEVQAPPPELLHATELAFLEHHDAGPRPPGWRLTPRAVVTFVCGSGGEILKLPKGARPPDGLPKQLAIREKFVGDRGIVERSVVPLAGERGLLLVGEPGTAKSMLSELLAAAVSGTSALTVQGTAGTTEDQLRYGWNYALLLAKGPVPEALVPSPVLAAMRAGKVARVEEVTRCLPEVQDALVSILSDRRMAVPELGEVMAAHKGFNVIATANLRDRGVSEMSAALKRRFNFETVFPIPDFQVEMDLVREEARRLLERSGVPTYPDDDMLDLLVTTFRELRAGQTKDGQAMDRLSVPMSTAEAVSVAYAMGVRSHFLEGAPPSAEDLVECLIGAAIKTDSEDVARLRRYFEQRVSKGQGPHWRAYYEARHRLPG